MGIFKGLFGSSSKSEYPLFDRFLEKIGDSNKGKHESAMEDATGRSEFMASYSARSLKDKSITDIQDLFENARVCIQELEPESGIIYVRMPVYNLNMAEDISDKLSDYCSSVRSKVKQEKKPK